MKRNLEIDVLAVLATGLFDLGAALLCPGAWEATGRHWLHGVGHREISGLPNTIADGADFLRLRAPTGRCKRISRAPVTGPACLPRRTPVFECVTCCVV